MRTENLYFDLTPRIVPADRETAVAIAPRFDHCRFDPDTTYEIRYFPTEEFAQRSGWPGNRTRAVAPVLGKLHATLYFEGEQEHVLCIEAVEGQDRRPVGEFRVYSVAEDLFARRAYKGDVHLHSNQSDGLESPAYVAAASRRIGLDFMAVTDHRKYGPSLEAQRAFSDVPVDLRIYPGEEVHPPDNPVHIIHFAGRFGINDLFEDRPAYLAGVKVIEDALGPLPPGVDRYEFASCVWCFDRIREAGGLGVFCHPYWMSQHRYTPSGALTAHLLDRQPFDAFEVIGGFHRFEIDSNTLQVARYHEERARGRRLPIVGVSDAHGCENADLFGWFYTVVFSPSLEAGDLISSIKDLHSVAVEALPGETPRAFGPFRLVKYALFLMREVFPQHDSLCVEEGREMLEHLAGDPRATARLAGLRGRVAALYDRYWARK